MAVLLVAVHRPAALLLATRLVAVVTRPVVELHPVALRPAVATRRKGPPVVAIRRPAAVLLLVVAILRPAAVLLLLVVAILRPAAVLLPVAAILLPVAAILLPVVATRLRAAVLPAVATRLPALVLQVAAIPRRAVLPVTRLPVLAPATRRARFLASLPPRNRTRCCSWASAAVASSCCR